MFPSKAILFTLITLLGGTSAATIAARETAGLDLTVGLCKGPGLVSGTQGGCTSITTSNGGCYADFTLLDADGGNWNDAISSTDTMSSQSVALGGAPFVCYLYSDANCTGRVILLDGVNLDLEEADFDNMASSVTCSYKSS